MELCKGTRYHMHLKNKGIRHVKIVESFKEKLCYQVRNYHQLYEVFFPRHSDMFKHLCWREISTNLTRFVYIMKNCLIEYSGVPPTGILQ